MRLSQKAQDALKILKDGGHFDPPILYLDARLYDARGNPQDGFTSTELNELIDLQLVTAHQEKYLIAGHNANNKEIFETRTSTTWIAK